jgi:hypothetical protein
MSFLFWRLMGCRLPFQFQERTADLRPDFASGVSVALPSYFHLFDLGLPPARHAVISQA